MNRIRTPNSHLNIARDNLLKAKDTDKNLYKAVDEILQYLEAREMRESDARSAGARVIKKSL